MVVPLHDWESAGEEDLPEAEQFVYWGSCSKPDSSIGVRFLPLD
jgi:hypothetical protein